MRGRDSETERLIDPERLNAGDTFHDADNGDNDVKETAEQSLSISD